MSLKSLIQRTRPPHDSPPTAQLGTQDMKVDNNAVVTEIQVLLEKSRCGSLSAINKQMLEELPGAEKLGALESCGSAANTTCNAVADASYAHDVLEAEVMRATRAIQDTSVQEALTLLLGLVRHTVSMMLMARETKEPEALRPRPKEPDLPDIPDVPRTPPSTAPSWPLPSAISRSPPVAKREACPAAPAPEPKRDSKPNIDLPLWLRISSSTKTAAAPSRAPTSSAPIPSLRDHPGAAATAPVLPDLLGAFQESKHPRMRVGQSKPSLEGAPGMHRCGSTGAIDTLITGAVGSSPNREGHDSDDDSFETESLSESEEAFVISGTSGDA